MVDVLMRLKEGVHGGCTYERPKKGETGKDVFMRDRRKEDIENVLRETKDNTRTLRISLLETKLGRTLRMYSWET